MGFPGGSDGKASACNVGGPGSIPGSGRSPGEGNGNPLQHSCLENPMNRGAWQAIVYGVAKSQTRLSDFTSLHFIYHNRHMLKVHGLHSLESSNSEPSFSKFWCCSNQLGARVPSSPLPIRNGQSGKQVFPSNSISKASACSIGDWVQSLGREDLLEKGMAIHSSILVHPPKKKGLKEILVIGSMV